MTGQIVTDLRSPLFFFPFLHYYDSCSDSKVPIMQCSLLHTHPESGEIQSFEMLYGFQV